MANFDVLVIGAGPAGYVAAIRAAQLGFNTALVEKDKTLGGTCLNVGCIPSKALLDSSEKFHAVQHAYSDHGIGVSGVKLDLAAMIKRKDGVVSKLTGGVAMLMKKNKITVLQGAAEFTDSKTVKVGKDSHSAKHIIIATGSVPVELPFAKFNGDTIISSTEALSLNKVPKHLVVIGAGVIGCELGSVWHRLGAQVTLVDMAPSLMPVMDGDLGKAAQKTFEAQGLNFELGVKVLDVKATKTGATVLVEKDGKPVEIKGDKVLVAVGRRANTENLNLQAAGVNANERGVIAVGEHYQTNVEGIYAIGDCTPGPMLAHKGEEEGVACVERLAGIAGHVNYNCIPWVVYTAPELAGVGLTSEQCKEQGIKVNVGKFSFAANGRALAADVGEGFVKMIADAKTDRILGVHMFGHHVSELIAEVAVAMEFGASAEDIARSVHAHPTMSEATKEAALAVDKRALHA